MSLLRLKPKSSPLRSNPSRQVVINFEGDEYFLELEDYVHRGYSRFKIRELNSSDNLPDDIKWKLFLARQIALSRIREIHG